MTHFHAPVGVYQHGPVVTVETTTPITAVHALLEERSISAVPVCRGAEPLGVLSRTDLLGRGTARGKGTRRKVALDFPDLSAGEVMHPGITTVTTETSVRAAAAMMVQSRIHRLFTTRDGQLDGVFGTREAMLAIVEARETTPIRTIMSEKAFTIPTDATVETATERLARAHAHGLVVVDEEGWPVGLFTQRDALMARHHPTSASVESAMSHGMLCLHSSTPLFRAAAQAADTRARRVLVIEDKKVVGVVTGLDFARVAAHGPE
jgi:CBS domain-containing protein